MYIRTKDGRIIESLTDIVEAYDKVPVYIYMVMNDGYKHCCHIQRDFVEKTSNTIEELCDVFVLDCKNKSLNNIFKNLIDARIFGSYSECEHEYYGAIWIVGEHGEPVLKSVARINEKEKLELL